MADGAVISLESEATMAFLSGDFPVVEDVLKKMPEDNRRKFIASLWDEGSVFYACTSCYCTRFKEERNPEGKAG
ncbi:MAG: hypothetical protein MUF61_02470 [archaeon]|jgi:hypothetical protein|nr:hypothetical protein [archaeon]